MKTINLLSGLVLFGLLSIGLATKFKGGRILQMGNQYIYVIAGHELHKYINEKDDGVLHRFDDTLTAVACSADGEHTWVTTGGKKLKYLDSSGHCELVDNYPYKPAGVAVSDDAHYLFVILETGEIIEYVDGKRICTLGTIPDEDFYDLNCTSDGSILYITTNTGIWKFDRNTKDFKRIHRREYARIAKLSAVNTGNI